MTTKAEALAAIRQQRRPGAFTFVCPFGDNVRTTFPLAYPHVKSVHGWGGLTPPSWWASGNDSDGGSR